MKKESKDNLYSEIAVGVSAGFIGQYIGDVIYNFLDPAGTPTASG